MYDKLLDEIERFDSLIKRVRHGDLKALGELLDTYLPIAMKQAEHGFKTSTNHEVLVSHFWRMTGSPLRDYLAGSGSSSSLIRRLVRVLLRIDELIWMGEADLRDAIESDIVNEKSDELPDEITMTMGSEELLAEIAHGTLEDSDVLLLPPLVLLVDPGSAPPEEIAELLTEISTLYQMVGGPGITFTMTDCREPVVEEVP